eukprot:GHRR01004124.1.p1 GENE.GHRR01004124.1~~GHRR01004124.1.p1  ORF type:complete len:184 (+),score=30.80 GHRR01004124.1:611-1162(+)
MSRQSDSVPTKRGSDDYAEQQQNVENWWLSESCEDERDGGSGTPQPKAAEDLLYDPNADDEDEQWAKQQRNGRQTDAILSCPGCFTTLSVDCQQHAIHHTQYRAMFTMNCDVKLDQVIKGEVQRPSGKQKRKRRQPEDNQQQHASPKQLEVLHPVCCAVCGTQIGAQDSDEIVHFSHVLASES